MSMALMKHCVVTPKKYRYITGILPNNKKIEESMELDLTIKEIKRCMMNGAIVQVLDDGSMLPLDERNYYSTDPITEEVNPPISEEDVSKIGDAKVGQAILRSFD